MKFPEWVANGVTFTICGVEIRIVNKRYVDGYVMRGDLKYFARTVEGVEIPIERHEYERFAALLMRTDNVT